MKVTADDIAQLLASPPPRQVPAHVVKAARKGRAAWGTAVFGLFFGAFGMIFVVVFFPWRFWDEWRLAWGGASSTTGLVSGVADAKMKVNGRRVMEYRFTFTPENGTPQTGACFADAGRWVPGNQMTIRYLPGTPGLACIEGSRLNKAGWFGSFVIIFPGVGFGMVAWFVYQRRQIRWLLREGQVAEVDVLSVEATQMRVNNRQVYKIVLAGQALGGQPVSVKRTNAADLELADRHTEKKQPVFVLHDPRKPRRLVFPEALIEPQD